SAPALRPKLAVLRLAHLQVRAVAGPGAPVHVQCHFPPTGQGTAPAFPAPGLVPPRGVGRTPGAAALSLSVDRTPGPGREHRHLLLPHENMGEDGRGHGAGPALRPGAGRPGVSDEVLERTRRL